MYFTADGWNDVSLTILRAYNKYDREIEVIVEDCGDTTVWVFSELHGPRYIVMADTLEGAFEAVCDHAPPVTEDDIHEAFNLTRQEYEALTANSTPEAWPDLADGYHYQPNATGTGIVQFDYEFRLDKYTEECGITLEVGEDCERCIDEKREFFALAHVVRSLKDMIVIAEQLRSLAAAHKSYTKYAITDAHHALREMGKQHGVYVYGRQES